MTKGRPIDLYTGLRERYYHHDKKKRTLKAKKFHKLVTPFLIQNKLRWLQTMYKRGKERDTMELTGVSNDKVHLVLTHKEIILEEFLEGE